MTTFPSSRAVAVDAGVDRVVVDGVDITWFRAVGMGPFQPTKVPGYSLVEPFGYGTSGSLVIPRTNCNFEAAGSGDLSFARKGATVLYQRVYGSTVVTDYRGIVAAVRTSGREFSLDVGGEVSCKASMRDRQLPVVRLLKDVGHWTQLALGNLGIPMNPPLGPVTGLTVPDQGGMTELAWLEQLGPLSQSRTGRQRAVMPETWGGPTYRFNVKQTTTKHLTVFADGDYISLDLVDDAAEQPTTFYGSGVDINGLRWKNARYPGIFDGDPAPYPFNDDRDFGRGTTDADTDTGDGITVLRINLLSFGYLDVGESSEAVYTQAMYDAVQEEKHAAGLFDNGTMTPAAWDALFNVDTTGYSNAGSTVFPLFQDPRVRKWNYSSDGAIIGRNDAYDPSVLDVHRTIDFGPGVSKKMARDYVRGLWTKQQAQKNWAGSINLNNSSVFAGEHDNTDAATLTSADVMVARDIRPGMNAWLPYFDGGTLVHIAGADVSEADGNGARTVRLTVDTQARDRLELAQILARNRESRRDIRREWLNANRPAKASGAMVSSDELFGILNRDVPLVGGQWNYIRVPVGQSGTINRTYFKTINDEAEFAYAIVSAEWTVPQFAHHFGNPLRTVDADTGVTWIDDDAVQALLNDKTVLMAAGTSAQPCGYGHRHKYGPAGGATGAPLTGTHFDDAQWSFESAGTRRPVVTIGIYPDRDCTLKAAKVLYVQADDVI